MKLKRMCWRVCAAAVMSMTVLVGDCPSGFAVEQVTVFTAASTTDALTRIGEMFASQGMGKVIFSFGASSTLAKQIENGAPANVFVSADEAWMDYLMERGRIESGTRGNLLGNRLALIAPSDSPLQMEIAPRFPLARALGDGRLALGDPDHVPAGKYAKAALEVLGVWPDVEEKLARADNVRAALTWVERGEAPLGIVYSTDAAASSRVRVIGIFPEHTHPSIRYPAALVAGAGTSAARSFLKFLRSPEAKAVFEMCGFAMVLE